MPTNVDCDAEASSECAQTVAGATGKLLQIEQLGAAVALPERVDVVDIADDLARAFCKARLRRSCKVFRLDQTAMHIGHASLDVLAKLELACALGDFQRADFSRPVVDVLEQAAVDGAQVLQVEIAGRYIF